jgi:hypothetical protein
LAFLGIFLAECQMNGALSFSSGRASYNTNMSEGLSVQIERARQWRHFRWRLNPC